MLPILDSGRLWGKLKRGAGNNNFNYGLASIASYLLHKGHQPEVLDPQFLSGLEELSNYLKIGRYDLIGLSAYTPNIVGTLKTAKFCRDVLPQASIVLGGPHCSYFPDTLADCEAVDYVIAREGEETLLELVKFLEEGKGEPSHILGLSYKNDGKVVVNPPRPYLDVNSLPMPAYGLFPLDKYNLQPTVYKRLPTVTTLVSRGCPYQCTFCHAYEVLGRRVRYRKVELVIEELQFLMKEFGTRGFMFQDSTFTLNRQWVKEFCTEVLRRQLDFTWMCLTRVDCVSPELLALMKQSGCFGISFGIESGNQKSLDLLRKGVTVEQNQVAIKMALDAGLYATATYMIGLPGEDELDAYRTFQFAKNNPTHIAHFFWPVPYPKTLFYEQCKADGGLQEDPSWESYNIYAETPVYVNPRLGLQKMKSLQKKMVRSYYFNHEVILMNLKSITTWTDVRKYLKAGLALSGFCF